MQPCHRLAKRGECGLLEDGKAFGGQGGQRVGGKISDDNFAFGSQRGR